MVLYISCCFQFCFLLNIVSEEMELWIYDVVDVSILTTTCSNSAPHPVTICFLNEMSICGQLMMNDHLISRLSGSSSEITTSHRSQHCLGQQLPIVRNEAAACLLSSEPGRKSLAKEPLVSGIIISNVLYFTQNDMFVEFTVLLRIH